LGHRQKRLVAVVHSGRASPDLKNRTCKLVFRDGAPPHKESGAGGAARGKTDFRADQRSKIPFRGIGEVMKSTHIVDIGKA